MLVLLGIQDQGRSEQHVRLMCDIWKSIVGINVNLSVVPARGWSQGSVLEVTWVRGMRSGKEHGLQHYCGSMATHTMQQKQEGALSKRPPLSKA